MRASWLLAICLLAYLGVEGLGAEPAEAQWVPTPAPPAGSDSLVAASLEAGDNADANDGETLPSEPAASQDEPADEEPAEEEAAEEEESEVEEDLSWKLFGDCCDPWVLGGWVSGGYTGNAHGNYSSIGNMPLFFNSVADGGVLDQAWFYAEKPLDMETYRFDWGLRVDYLFGTEGPGSQAFGDRGWDFGWTSSRDYGSAIPQAYAQFGIDDLSVIVGYFWGLQGYEWTDAPVNFFYTHNYAFDYGVPGSHSGTLFTYPLSDSVQIQGGWVAGWDTSFANHIDASMFVGGLTWNITDATMIFYSLTTGIFGDGTAKGGFPSYDGTLYSHSIVFDHDFAEKWKYVLENTVGSNSDLGPDNNQWFSVTNWLIYEIDECWSVGGRVDWFRDDDGARVASNGAGPGSYWSTTFGLNYKPNYNLTIRPEVRWDWFAGDGVPYDSRDGGETGNESEQFTAAIDAVFTF